MIEHLAAPMGVKKFAALWLPTVAMAAAMPNGAIPLGDRFLIDAFGLPVPIVTCLLGALGIVLARPFAHVSEYDLGWKLRLLVGLIMLVIVQLWIIETRPGWLFAFVVAIGLGFAGHSLLEQFAEQTGELLRRMFGAAAADAIIGKGHDGP
ncbi:MAG: hypothetical protein ACK4IS_07255 [Erythrobacter sp.]